MRESLCASELFFNFGHPKMFKVSHNTCIFVMLQKEHPENEIWILQTDRRKDKATTICSPFGEHKKDVQCTLTCAGSGCCSGSVQIA